MKTIKYGELVKAVREQCGKVVVIDVWADFCVPCKQEFHNLVEMHQQHGDKGLVCMSVALDPSEDDKEGVPPPGVQKFLGKQKATFANFWLDENPKVWQECCTFKVRRPCSCSIVRAVLLPGSIPRTRTSPSNMRT